jgi:hypothetical protein
MKFILNPVSHKEAGFCICGIHRQPLRVLCHTIDDNGVWANMPENAVNIIISGHICLIING